MPENRPELLRRQRLVSPFTVIGVAVAASAVFVGFFPAASRIEHFVHHHKPDALSIAYLRLLVQTHPEDLVLRRALASDLTKTGNHMEALAVLEPALSLPQKGERATRLQALEIILALIEASPRSSARYPAVRAEAVRMLESLRVQTTAPADFDQLLAIALALNLPSSSASLYLERARLDPAQAARWLGLAARQQLAANHPGVAASTFAAAAQAAGNDLSAFRAWTDRAIDAHLSADAGSQALRLALDAVPRLKDDASFLQRVMNLALAQDDPAQVQRVGRALLAQAPNDAALLHRQLTIELNAHDQTSALALVPRLVASDPDNAALRLELAQILQNLGEMDQALAQWRVLARDPGLGAAIEPGLRLAYLQHRDDLWLTFAVIAIRGKALSKQALAELREIQTRSPSPEPVIRFLKIYVLQSNSRRPLWEEFAQRYQSQGKTTTAINMWQQADVRLASPLVAAMRLATLYRLQNAPAQARDALKKARPFATQQDLGFWEAFGDLAWELDDHVGAREAYSQAWASGTTSVLAAERLIQLQLLRGDHAGAVDFGQRADVRLGGERWLLLAMDAAARGELWRALHTMGTATGAQDRLAGSEMYWLLRGLGERQTGDLAAARRSYGRALVINPTSASIRNQILWADVDADDRTALATHLAQWQGDAATDAALWNVYVLGLQRLERHDEAVAFLERQAPTAAASPAWLLQAATATHRAAPSTATARFRDFLLAQLRTASARPMQSPSQDASAQSKSLMLAEVLLLRDRGDGVAADSVLREAVARGHNDVDVYAALVESHLARKDYAAASDWLQRAHGDARHLPGYQVLAVAIAQNDLPRIEQLLAEEATVLSAADRITGMRRLGRQRAAMALADHALAQQSADGSETASRARLRQHREELSDALAARLAVGHEKHRIADLAITQQTVQASVALGDARIGLQLAHNLLASEGVAELMRARVNENDISVTGSFTVRGDPVSIVVGSNARPDSPLIYGRLRMAHAIGPSVTGSIDLRWNALNEDTAALRIGGSKHSAVVSLNGQITETTDARGQIAWQQFQTRNGQLLARGNHVEGELGRTLLADRRTWRLRLSAGGDRNRLVSLLPLDSSSASLPALLPVASVVAPWFGTAGVGSMFGYTFGSMTTPSRQTIVTVDGWVGRQWPQGVSAYSARAGLQLPLPVPLPGMLKFDAFYTNVQKGLAAQASRGAGLQYESRF